MAEEQLIEDFDPIPELCPRCGMREQAQPPAGPKGRGHTSSGFCNECLDLHVLELYKIDEYGRARARHEEWRKRSDATRAVEAARVQRYRLKERIRPRSPNPRGSDPWQLADEALKLLNGLRAHVQHAPDRIHMRNHIEDVMDLVRRLAWGPGD
jgi:hypothetical protein